MSRFKAIILSVALMQTGCTATIELRGKQEVEGRILSSDRDSVTIGIDDRRFRLPAEEVKDIDHPGSGLLVAGIVVGGVALLMANSSSLGDRLQADGMAMIGLGLALGGAIPWYRSKGAAAGFEDR